MLQILCLFAELFTSQEKEKLSETDIVVTRRFYEHQIKELNNNEISNKPFYPAYTSDSIKHSPFEFKYSNKLNRKRSYNDSEMISSEYDPNYINSQNYIGSKKPTNYIVRETTENNNSTEGKIVTISEKSDGSISHGLAYTMLNDIVLDVSTYRTNLDVFEYFNSIKFDNNDILYLLFKSDINFLVKITSIIIDNLCTLLKIKVPLPLHRDYRILLDKLIFDLTKNKAKLDVIKSHSKILHIDSKNSIFERPTKELEKTISWNLLNNKTAKDTFEKLTRFSEETIINFDFKYLLLTMLKEFRNSNDIQLNIASVTALIAIDFIIFENQLIELTTIHKKEAMLHIICILKAYNTLKEVCSKGDLILHISQLIDNVLKSTILSNHDSVFFDVLLKNREQISEKKDQLNSYNVLSSSNLIFITNIFGPNSRFMKFYQGQNTKLWDTMEQNRIYSCLIKQAFKTFDDIYKAFSSNIIVENPFIDLSD